jgi:hypothetical protein
MSDEITTETVTEEVSTPETETTVEPHGSSEVDWKKEARKWEARAKEANALKDDAERWREYEQSQKSDHEKLAERLATAESTASEAVAQLTRYEVATQKGIPADALELLQGSDRTQLEASADKLLSLIADQSKPKLRPDTNQGQPAPANVGQITRAELETMTPSEIMKAKAEGRLTDLLRS